MHNRITTVYIFLSSLFFIGYEAKIKQIHSLLSPSIHFRHKGFFFHFIPPTKTKIQMRMTNTSCLSEKFYRCDITSWPKQKIWRAKGLFHPMACSQLSREVWAVTWRQALMQRPWIQAAGLHLLSFSACFLTHQKSTYTGLAPPKMC